MSKYSNRSTKQLINLLQNRGYYNRNGGLYDICVRVTPTQKKRVLTNFDRKTLISFLDQYDSIYSQTIKTPRRYNLSNSRTFSLGYNFYRIKHGESL